MAYGECNSCNEECKYFEQPPKPVLADTQEHGGYSDTHHLYWPKKFYTTLLEKAFVELEENKVQTCRAEHDEIHATEKPPRKPSRSEMIQAVAESAIRRAAD
jgi:hypothetical protein